jgi:hypothetical protein
VPQARVNGAALRTPVAGLRLRCRGGDFAEECHHALNQDKSEIPERSTTPRGSWTPDTVRVAPQRSAGLPLLQTADTQQSTLRDG